MLEIQIMNRHGEGRSPPVGISEAPMISYDLCQLPLIPACPDKKPRETQETIWGISIKLDTRIYARTTVIEDTKCAPAIIEEVVKPLTNGFLVRIE